MKGKKLLCLALAVLFTGVLATLPALAEEAALEPITFTFFDKNTGDAFDNPVAKEITRLTGVTLEIMQPSADPTEKLGLMLASGDLADFILMDRSSDMVNKYIAAGALIPLNDLIDEHGPDIAEQYGEVLNKSRYSDGKNYYLNNWYGVDPDPVYGWLVRQDWLAEIVGEKAYTAEGFTLEEMRDILIQFKEKYPEIDGSPSTPITWKGIDPEYINILYGANGGYPYWVQDGKLMRRERDPMFKEAMLFANQLQLDSSLDVDWVSYSSDQLDSKLSSGTVFSVLTTYWGVNNANGVLRGLSDNIESQYYAYKIYNEEVGADKAMLGGRSTLGWDAIGISRNCADPVRAIQFANFLASDEGQFLLMWGVEGVTWNMVDGKRVPADGILDAFKTDWSGTARETGVSKWTYFIKNGNGKDGTTYYMVGKYDRIPTERFAEMTLGDTLYINDEFNNLHPEGGTALSMNYQRMEDTTKVALPMIVMAASQEEAEALYEQMIADMDAAGAAEVEEYMNEKYHARLEEWK